MYVLGFFKDLVINLLFLPQNFIKSEVSNFCEKFDS